MASGQAHLVQVDAQVLNMLQAVPKRIFRTIPLHCEVRFHRVDLHPIEKAEELNWPRWREGSLARHSRQGVLAIRIPDIGNRFNWETKHGAPGARGDGPTVAPTKLGGDFLLPKVIISQVRAHCEQTRRSAQG
jgi:hypothetical protein